jgi:hypothetical protein
MTVECKQCGYDNKEDSRFCADCGVELETAAERERPRACQACEYMNTADCTYCGGCGVEMRSGGIEHRRKHGRNLEQSQRKARHVQRKSRFHPLTVGFFVVGGFVLLVLVLDSKTGIPEQARPAPIVEARSTDPALEARVMDVASKFICSCGTCGEQSLDVCSCETAVQEREFIRTSLQSGQSVDMVSLAVQDKFGWVKPAFSAKIDSLARKAGRRINAASASSRAKPGELRRKLSDSRTFGCHRWARQRSRQL